MTREVSAPHEVNDTVSFKRKGREKKSLGMILLP